MGHTDSARHRAAAAEKCCGEGNEIVKTCYRTAFHLPCAGDGMYCCPYSSRGEAPDEDAADKITFVPAKAVKLSPGAGKKGKKASGKKKSGGKKKAGGGKKKAGGRARRARDTSRRPRGTPKA